MQNKFLSVASVAGFLMLSTAAFAQTNVGVDPACVMKNADGTETVDKAKCPDGMKVGAGNATTTAPDTTATIAPDATATTTPMAKTMIVPPESFSGAVVIQFPSMR